MAPAYRFALLVLVFPVLAGFAGAASAAQRKIEAFGDSIFAGYGLQAEEAFPARLEAALRHDGFPASVVTAAVSGDTTQDGLSRVDWMLGDNPDLVIVELGGNDLLRAFSPNLAKANLDAICGRIASKHVPIVLAGMLAPRNMGDDYSGRFDAIYPALAEKYNAPLYKFILQDVMFHADLMQADGIHPNARGVDIMVKGILPLVEGELRKTP